MLVTFPLQTYLFYRLFTNWYITSKINGTPKGVHLLVSKLHTILVVANLLVHNNISQICYCGEISLQSDAVNCSFSDTFRGNIYFAGDGTLKHIFINVSVFFTRTANYSLNQKYAPRVTSNLSQICSFHQQSDNRITNFCRNYSAVEEMFHI